jgi:hypothetical protein
MSGIRPRTTRLARENPRRPLSRCSIHQAAVRPSFCHLKLSPAKIQATEFRLRMTLALSMSTKETEPPCQLYPHYIECNSDPADPGKTNAEFARSAGYNERSPSRLQDPPNAIRSTPTHPFHGAPQVDPYSLKQIQFCELVSSL